MPNNELSFIAMGLCLFLLVLPLSLCYVAGLRSLITDTLFAVVRMVGQLLLVAMLLKYLFTSNNMLLIIAWILTMVIFASSTVVKNCNLNLKYLFMPVLLSFFITLFFLLVYLNVFVLGDYSFFDPRFLIVIGGMLLGNSLRCTIVGLSQFYNDLKNSHKQYLYTLSLGATRIEALAPYFRTSLSSAIRPTVASMASMGIVFIPGMMTGQILGGSNPMLAIQYQVMIMISIFTVGMLSTALGILFSLKISFTPYGILRDCIFNKKD